MDAVTRSRAERPTAPDADGLLRRLLPEEMPVVAGNRVLEETDIEEGGRLTLLQHPGLLSGEDQYRFNLVHRPSDDPIVWLGGVNALSDAPRLWSIEARLELSAEDVVNGLYHAGWEYEPFVEWLERLASLHVTRAVPHIARLLQAGARFYDQVRSLWLPFSDPAWIEGEVRASFPGTVAGSSRDTALELQRMELAQRFGMPESAFRREAHRWVLDWQKVPGSHPAAQNRLERLPAVSVSSGHHRGSPQLLHTDPRRTGIRPSLSLAGMYQAMPDRRALVETLAAGDKKGAGRPGANVGMVWKLATQSIYASGDLPMLAARECAQNSRDSLRAAYRLKSLKPGEGRFEIRWDSSRHELVFEDNGVGMDVETILGPFLTLGESTKRGEGSEAAGGFGIAKAVILGASNSFTWELHTRDNLAVSQGHGRDVEVFQSEFRPGVQLTLHDVSGDLAWDYALGQWRDVDSRMKELLAACDLPDIQLYYNGERIPPLFSRRKGSPVEVEGSWGAGTTAKVKAYRRSDKGGAYWIRIDGLYQYKQASVSGNLRADVVIDLTPTSRPSEKGYPLNASRDQFVEPARSTFRAVVKEVEKENLSVGKKKEDEVFALEEGTAEDADTREALYELTSSLMDDPELAALLGEEKGSSRGGAAEATSPDLSPVPVSPSALESVAQGWTPAGEWEPTASSLPPGLVDVDPQASIPVWGKHGELPGFPPELSSPAQLWQLFNAMAQVGQPVSTEAVNALEAAEGGNLTGAGLLDLAHAASTALDVYTGRVPPDPSGTMPPEELEPIPLPRRGDGQPLFPNGFDSLDPASLRARMLSADARGQHFPAPAWQALEQADAQGTLSYLQLELLQSAEDQAMKVNAGTVEPARVPLTPLGEMQPEAILLTPHKQYIQLEETGGLLPGLPPGLNTYDQVKAFLTDGLHRVPGAVPEEQVEQVISALASDPIPRAELVELVGVVGDMARALEASRVGDSTTATRGVPRARVNAGPVKLPSGSNPFGAVAAVRIAAGYPKDRARAFKRNPARWLPYLALWDLTLKLILKEAKISRRFKPGFLLDDDTVGLASKQDGDRYALVLINADRFEEAVRANRERPLSIAAFVHGVGVHEVAHLDGKMGDGHDEEYVAKREDLGNETAHLLTVLTKAAVKLLKLPEPRDPVQAKLLKLERDLQRAKEGRDTARADRARAVRELEKALRDCRRALEKQGAPESVKTCQACDASGSSGVPAHIVVPPKSPGARGAFTDLELRAVQTATQSMEGARERWAFLTAMGATDAELEQALRYELGARGGSSGPDGSWLDFSGTALVVSVQTAQGVESSIKGRRLVQAARRLYGIEDHGEVDPRIRRVFYGLIQNLRDALRDSVPADYLYRFFARHRQTLIEALARRFGSSDPALLPARLERSAREDAETLPSRRGAGARPVQQRLELKAVPRPRPRPARLPAWNDPDPEDRCPDCDDRGWYHDGDGALIRCTYCGRYDSDEAMAEAHFDLGCDLCGWPAGGEDDYSGSTVSPQPAHPAIGHRARLLEDWYDGLTWRHTFPVGLSGTIVDVDARGRAELNFDRSLPMTWRLHDDDPGDLEGIFVPLSVLYVEGMP